jgi:molybdopterin-guanine dinucleotide biosynthesis protein A
MPRRENAETQIAMRSARYFAIVLMGGLARRMGGGDKGLRELGGMTLLARVVAAMRPQCDGLVLNANGDPARLGRIALPVVGDDMQGFPGPLAGILAGLDWIAAHLPDIKDAVSVPADTPFLPADLVARLIEAREKNNAMLAYARSGTRTHPLVALWPVAIRRDLRRVLVKEDRRKVDDFIQRYSCAVADWPIEPFDPFFNVNEPGDLAVAETILVGRKTPIA